MCACDGEGEREREGGGGGSTHLAWHNFDNPRARMLEFCQQTRGLGKTRKKKNLLKDTERETFFEIRHKYTAHTRTQGTCPTPTFYPLMAVFSVTLHTVRSMKCAMRFDNQVTRHFGNTLQGVNVLRTTPQNTYKLPSDLELMKRNEREERVLSSLYFQHKLFRELASWYPLR